MSLARKFLWIVAILIVVFLVGAITWRFAGQRLLQVALSPSIAFSESPVAPPPDYGNRNSWLARPDIAQNPAMWTPDGIKRAPHPAAAVFFISPTAFLERGRWNSPLNDRDTNERLDRYARWQASVFNGVGDIWIPRYRQATLGAFFKPGPDADKALDLAYGDVLRAFDVFLAAQPAGRPLILAGHSQGSRHLLHLLRDRADRLGGRLVAAYVGGWPVAMPQDTDAIGLAPCTSTAQYGCVLSWQSFAHDGDIEAALAGFETVPDLAGQPLGTRPMLCTNPLTGGAKPAATAERNAGTLFQDDQLKPHVAGARCNARGLLLLDPAPGDIGSFVLPGGNFHAYDYNLFWSNLRADAEARLSAWGGDHAEDGLAADSLEPEAKPADQPQAAANDA